MRRIFVFVNQKGGVGKTTSALNIGAYMAESGKNVLLVDFDSQANLSSGIGIKSEKNGIYEVISGKIPVEQAVKKTVCDGLSIIPASMDLSGATVELINQKRYDQFLKKALLPLAKIYDYILIDCPPSLGVLTLNGLAAANGVLIPMQCEYFALEGLSMLLQTIKRIQQSINPDLAIDGIFFTMYDQRTRLAQQVVKHVGVYFKDRVFSTIIPRNVRLSEAPSHGLPISKYDAACQGALAYKNLANELMRFTEDKYGRD
ncbi:MAG: ParA family protein [Spirochaetaceae bacterium]|jgi:chromosome partitioning protein|nr:ParA family protein [Spirochaetaceae bacterium]